MKKKILAYILPLLLFIPSVLAEITVKDSFMSFAEGVRGLVHGNLSLFVDGIIASLPLFGLIVIIWSLMFFITKITIFKDDKHSRYAKMFAWGVALIGVAQQSVFNSILGLSKSFLILTFLISIIFMFILFINYNRTTHFEMNTTMFNKENAYIKSKKDFKTEKRALLGLEHEMSLDEKNYKRINRDVSVLDDELRDSERLAGSELHQVNKMLDLLRKLISVAQKDDKSKVHSFVETLSRDLSGLASFFSRDKKNLTSFYKIQEELIRYEDYLIKDEGKENTEENHLIKILKHHLSHNLNLSSEEVEKIHKKLLRENNEIHKHLIGIRESVLSMAHFRKEIDSNLRNLEQVGPVTKREKIFEVRSALLSYQFGEAQKRLTELKELILEEEHILNMLSHFENKIKNLIGKINNHEKSLEVLVRDFERNAKKEFEEENSKK